MKPTMTLECTNADCAEHGKVIASDEDPCTLGFYHCKTCYLAQRVTIVHGGVTYRSADEFNAFTSGLLREIEGLHKLIDRKVAEPDEQVRYDEIIALLSDAKCPCCLNPFLDENSIPLFVRSRMEAKKAQERKN